MRIVGLLSGGKDSCYAMMQCVAAGHEIVALATLLPPPGVEESNSHMYQSVGVSGVHSIAEAMGVPLFTRTLTGTSVNTTAHYSEPLPQDEVEDLFHLLKQVKESLLAGVEGVSSGAILSDYQRVRVESVCGRLGLVSYAYLWRRDQDDLLEEMGECGMEAVLVKVAGAGLIPSKHCGRTLQHMLPVLRTLNSRFGLHVCGEGGEFETFTLDCPLYSKRINIVQQRLVEEPGDVGYLLLDQLQLQDKQQDAQASIVSRVLAAGVPCVSHCDAQGTEAAQEPATPADTHTPAPPCRVVTAVGQKSRSGALLQWAGGWWAASNWRGENVDELLRRVAEQLSARGVSLTSTACQVRAYVRSLADYAHFNAAYRQHFGYNPPVRACLQTSLPCYCQLEVLGYSGVQQQQQPPPRHTMHVQSVSHWAPANIGPYSQAVTVGPVVLLAGMLGLVPGSMKLVPGGAAAEATLALRHVSRVLQAVTRPEAGLEQLAQVVCYSSSAEASSSSAASLAGLRCCVLQLLVERLPKDAAVELHCWAHAARTPDDHELTASERRVAGWVLSVQQLRLPDGAASLVASLAPVPHAENNGTGTAEIQPGHIVDVLKIVIDKISPEVQQHYSDESNNTLSMDNLTVGSRTASSESGPPPSGCSPAGSPTPPGGAGAGSCLLLTLYHSAALVPCGAVAAALHSLAGSRPDVALTAVPVVAVASGAAVLAVTVNRHCSPR